VNLVIFWCGLSNGFNLADLQDDASFFFKKIK